MGEICYKMKRERPLSWSWVNAETRWQLPWYLCEVKGFGEVIEKSKSAKSRGYYAALFELYLRAGDYGEGMDPDHKTEIKNLWYWLLKSVISLTRWGFGLIL